MKKILFVFGFMFLTLGLFAQKASKKEPQVKISDSKNSPQVTVVDSVNVSAKEPKHKAKESKQVTVTTTDKDNDSTNVPPKDAIIINDKKSNQPK